MPDLTILHGCRTIQLTRGLNTLIDEADFETVCHLRWHIRGTGNNSYATHSEPTGSTPKHRPVRLHRLLTSTADDKRIDHKNGDRLDNRKYNLRTATRLENNRNIHVPKGKSRFKGVIWDASKNCWKARIGIEGKALYLGSSQTEEECALLYDAAARKFFGEFACTNLDIYGAY